MTRSRQSTARGDISSTKARTQSPRKDGLREWEAWRSGKNLKPVEAARERSRVLSKESARKSARKTFEQDSQGEDPSTSSSGRMSQTEKES